MLLQIYSLFKHKLNLSELKYKKKYPDRIRGLNLKMID